MFFIKWWKYFLDLNHRLCLEDPLQDEFRLKNIWIDSCLVFVFLYLIIKKLDNKTFDMSSKNKKQLRCIRNLGAIAGCVYIAAAYFIERCTLARFILSRPRFLTENFVIYFALYYSCISIWEILGKSPSNRLFNIWFNSLLLGTAIVTFGWWFLVMPYSWKYQGISPRIHDLLGHFFNLVWVLWEWSFFPNHQIGISSLFLVLFLLSCYSCLIWFYQEIEFICWVPYGPILAYTPYRLIAILGIVVLFLILKYILKDKLKK